MKTEAICKCQSCAGEIRFIPDSTYETVVCPYCGQETVLRKPKSSRVPALIVVILLAVVSGMYFFVTRIEFGKPADGGFGFKLGDKIPPGLMTSVSNDSDWPVYRFNPGKDHTPFESVTLSLLPDGRVYRIHGWGSSFLFSCDEILVPALSEKYGLRKHLISRPTEYGVIPTHWYYFGTQERYACLMVSPGLFTLEYKSTELERIAELEKKLRAEKRNAPQKAALQQRL